MTHIIDVFQKLNGNAFMSVDMTTEPKMRKTLDTDDGRIPNPHFGRVKKVVIGASVSVAQNKYSSAYQNAVRSHLVKAGLDPANYEPKPRKWGVRVPGLPIVVHGDQVYLDMIFHRSGNVYYTLDGTLINKSDVLGLSDTTYESPTHQGGLEAKDQVTVRSVKIENLDAIRYNHQEYTNLTY